jgi:hypothetical protein
MEQNIFEQATRSKIRFISPKGIITTEDLWDLSLLSLNSLAKALYRTVKESEEISFIDAKSKADTETELRFSIVKSIIDTKLTEKEFQRLATVAADRKKLLLSILESKQQDALQGMSQEELLKELEALK